MNIILLSKDVFFMPENKDYSQKKYLLSKKDIQAHEPLAWSKTWISEALDWRHEDYILILKGVKDPKNKGRIIIQMEDQSHKGPWVFCKIGKSKKAWREMQFVCQLDWRTMPAFWNAPAFVRLVKQKVQDSIDEHRRREAEQHALVEKYLGFGNLFPTPLK